MEIDIERVKRLYAIIRNESLSDADIQDRVNIIHELECLTRREFNSTTDFHRKVSEYIARGDYGGGRLKAARKQKKWSQNALATHLGMTQQAVQQMESGKRPLSDVASKWVESISTYGKPHFACGIDIDNKQVTGGKNWVSDTVLTGEPISASL